MERRHPLTRHIYQGDFDKDINLLQSKYQGLWKEPFNQEHDRVGWRNEGFLDDCNDVRYNDILKYTFLGAIRGIGYKIYQEGSNCSQNSLRHDTCVLNRVEILIILMLAETLIPEFHQKIVKIYERICERTDPILRKHEYKEIVGLLELPSRTYSEKFETPFFYDTPKLTLWDKMKYKLNRREPTPHLQSRSSVEIALHDPLKAVIISLYPEGLATEKNSIMKSVNLLDSRGLRRNILTFYVSEINRDVLTEIRKYSNNFIISHADSKRCEKALEKHSGLFDHMLTSDYTKN